jgi:hypothetical protein
VIESGLTSGEPVVTVGHMMIAPGAKVQVVPPAGAGPQNASASAAH